jgi:hypothetical protein
MTQMIGPVLLGLAFSFSAHSSSLKVAIFDTGFCPALLAKRKGVTLTPINDFASAGPMKCAQFDAKNRRYHGQLVLEEFLKYLPLKVSVEIHPYIIFDVRGVQSPAAWKAALEDIKTKKIEVLLAAAGLPLTPPNDTIAKTLPAPEVIAFLASGRQGPFIKADTELFPQLHYKDKNIFLIGSYFPPLFKDDYLSDDKLLYREHIAFYMSSGDSKAVLTGTSRSVAHALAAAIEVCGDQFKKNAVELRECLTGKFKIVRDPMGKVDMKTLESR